MKQLLNRIGVLLLIGTLSLFKAYGQQLKFRSDFSLNGPVKKCTVLTSYGKEIYSFTKDGKLQELTSYFDDNNYQQIRYTYKDSLLIERRIELYEMGKLDPQASSINVYQSDSTGLLQKQFIVDYNSNTLEELSYSYDSIGRLAQLKKLTKNGLSTIQYTSATDSLGHIHNTVLIDSVIRRQTDSIPLALLHKDSLTHTRTIYYLDGIEDRAEEKKYNHKSAIVYSKNELYLLDDNQWYVQKQEEFEFNEKGQMIQKVTKEGTTSFTQKFLYQTDGTEYQNWVKQIVMPNMTYITRIIEYFEEN